MVGFDAERYLHVLGEKLRGDQDSDSPFARPIDHVAAALVAVGALTVDEARGVLAQYRPELNVKAGAQDDLTDGGCRVVALHADLRLASGTLRLSHTRLSDDETAIAAKYRADPRHVGVHHDWIRVPSGWPSGVQPLVLADDRGTKVALTFAGSGNDDRWQATLRAQSPLAPRTAWFPRGQSSSHRFRTARAKSRSAGSFTPTAGATVSHAKPPAPYWTTDSPTA